MNNASFADCLSLGHRYERYFAEEIMDEYVFEQSRGREPGWDLRSADEKDEWVYFEVKADTMAARTGNLAIEIQSSGCLSGIKTTTADWWIQFVVGTPYYYEFPVPELREFIAKTNLRTVRACENGKNTLVLIPMNLLSEWRKEIENQKRRVV
jgi:hypothetical protein